MLVGEMLKRKNSDGEFVINFSRLKDGETITFTNKDVLFGTKPDVHVDGLVNAGKLSPEQAQEILAKTPDFVSLKIGADRKNIRTS